MGLITFPTSFPTAFPASAERQYKKSAPFWINPMNGRRGDRITWWIPREDVGDALAWVGGQVETIPSVWGGVSRVVRMQSPDDAGQYAVYASVEWQGNSFDSDMYSSALLTVDFATPEYEDTGDTPYAEIDTEYSAEGITLPGRYLKIESTGETLNRDSHKAVGAVAYVLTVYNTPSINPAIISAALTSPVNSAPFYLPRFGTVDPGYALLRTYKASNKFYLGGQVSMNVSYQIQLRFGLTWQETIHRGGVETILHADGSPFYGTSDLNVLFTA